MHTNAIHAPLPLPLPLSSCPHSYNNAAKTGGAVIFKAKKLTVCSNCQIDVTGKGWRGAASQYGSSGYGSNVRNRGGEGPGAGVGGKGGNPSGCGAHGSGGGGGSSYTVGGIGTPDIPRCYHEVSATPGKTYDMDTGEIAHYGPA